MTARPIMTRKDMSEAAIALIRWIESQDIKTTDAVPVLVVALAGIIESLALENKTDAADGARIVGNMIRETVEELK